MTRQDYQHEEPTTYEGWHNRETWAVNLWLNNDEPTYNEARYIARNRATVYESEQDLAEYTENQVLDRLVGGECPPASLALDLLQGALGSVDWREIVEGLREE